MKEERSIPKKKSEGPRRNETLVVGRDEPRWERARRSFREFVGEVAPDMEWSPFHEAYYRLLGEFAEGRIRRMMVCVPPQHGKSRGAAVLLPAFLLGRNPDRRLAVASYSFALAGRFGREVQRVMEGEAYGRIFPWTRLKGVPGGDRRGERTARRTLQEFDCVGREGGVRMVGRAGSLTGNRVDVMVTDDLYKNMLEANSPRVRERVWEWYQAVVRTRLHDGAQELVVSTRWHEEDLIGRMMRVERVVVPTRWEQIAGIGTERWVAVVFEAIKSSPSTQIDPRDRGEALWPQRHSVGWLRQRRGTEPVLFEALFQGNPVVREGLLYGGFETYARLPERIVRRANYTDTADTGGDRLCSICYAVGADGVCYVTGVVYSEEPMERTEREVAEMLAREGTTVAYIESNNGGRGFGRAVERRLREEGMRGCTFRMFHQAGNKESRILTYAPTVERMIRFPEDWQRRWPELAAEVVGFRRVFRANAHDDGPDVLTGIVETELEPKRGRLRIGGFAKE